MLTEEQEQCCIVKKAAKIIKNAIKKLNANSKSCSSSDEMKLSEKKAVNIFLNLFVSFRILFVGKGKSFHLASIGQAIMQQVQPNILIVTLKLGLGIQMPQHFGSRFLTDSLNKYGFCVPYKKVLKYELRAAVYKGTKIPVVSESSSAKTTHLMHHVADNANHNPATLGRL